jgi:hypothetical protein
VVSLPVGGTDQGTEGKQERGLSCCLTSSGGDGLLSKSPQNGPHPIDAVKATQSGVLGQEISPEINPLDRQEP